jgi:hypothetical protein
VYLPGKTTVPPSGRAVVMTCVGPGVGDGVAAGTDGTTAGVDATEREGAGGDELAVAAHPDATSASNNAPIPIVCGSRAED